MQTPRVHTPIECVDVKLSTLDNAYTGLSRAHGHTASRPRTNIVRVEQRVPIFIVACQLCDVYLLKTPSHAVIAFGRQRRDRRSKRKCLVCLLQGLGAQKMFVTERMLNKNEN